MGFDLLKAIGAAVFCYASVMYGTAESLVQTFPTSCSYACCVGFFSLGVKTEFMRRKVSHEGWDTQLGVWGRGVDPDLFSPARRSQHLRRQLGLGRNDIAALWLGRVVHEKQPAVWLRVRNSACIEIFLHNTVSSIGSSGKI